MHLVIFQKGFNFSQDGPGNRLVIHLQGCNMKCPWCANPEGMEPSPEKYSLQGSFKRWAVDVDELIQEAVDCRPMFFDGGGVTLTGGEPTMQFEPAAKLLRGLKAAGINTAMETNAASPRLCELFPYIDWLMADFKHYDTKKHLEWTGVGNQIIKRNIKAAAAAKKPVALRIPLINGFNASIEDIPGFLAFLKELDNRLFSVELLRYHEFGKNKWEKCGFEYKVENGFVSNKIMGAFEKEFSAAGIKIVRT